MVNDDIPGFHEEMPLLLAHDDILCSCVAALIYGWRR